MADAWTYADYITYERSDATRLTRLRLHIQEITQAIDNEMRTGGDDIESRELRMMWADLKKEERELSALQASLSGSRFVMGRPR